MITLLYCKINSLNDHEISSYISELPYFMHSDVMRYKNTTDKKLALLSRLMLKEALKSTRKLHLLNEWERNRYNKPFIKGWYPFNSSHSGIYTVFTYSDSIIGVDIEEKCILNFESLIDLFHVEEQDYLVNSWDIKESFFELWTKKESFLKAVGIGITNGLKEFNCLPPSVNYNCVSWYFHHFEIDSQYASHICNLNHKYDIIIKEFLPDRL